MSYFNNLQEEEYRPPPGRRPSNGRSRNSGSRGGSRGMDESSTSVSDRFMDEPDSRDSVQRPLSSVASSGRSTSVKKHTKKKKKKVKREVAGSIPEGTPAVIETVVRNDSQASSSMASEVYSLRSAGMSFNSSSSNILEAYRRLKTMSRDQVLATRHEQGEHGSSSANTNETPSSTQQTPATSTSTQMSTDDDYLQNSPPSMHQPASPDHGNAGSGNGNGNRGVANNIRTDGGTDVAPEYPPPRYPTQNKQKPPKYQQPQQQQSKRRQSQLQPKQPSLVPEYLPPEFPSQEQAPREQAPPKQIPRNSVKGATKKNTSKRGSKVNGGGSDHLQGQQTGPSSRPKSRTPTPTSTSKTEQQSQRTITPRPSKRISKNPYEDLPDLQPGEGEKVAASIQEQAPRSQSMPPQQVYAAYNINNNNPVANDKTSSMLERNKALQHSGHSTHSPVPNGVTVTSSQITTTTGNNTSTAVDPIPHNSRRGTNSPPPDAPAVPNFYRGESIFFENTTDDEDGDELGSLDPARFRGSMRDNLQSGAEFDPRVSRRMDSVKEKLRANIKPSEQHKSRNTTVKIKEEHSKQEEDNSSKSSSSSSSSGKGGIMGFLSGFRGHPKQTMTEEERRIAQNPFLNRPTAIKMYSTIGHHNNKKGANVGDETEKDYTRRVGSDVDSDFSDDSSEASSVIPEKKRFPLPEPVRKFQQFCGTIVTNMNFQIFMVVLIMLNAAVLGIATYDFDNPKIPRALDVIDRVLLVIFTIELALQFGYCGYHLFLDGWLVFDTLTVVTSWWLEEVQVFRSFRIFRSFRLVVRLPLLKNLVLTIFHVMPRVYSIGALLLLILYVYGVLVTILFGYQKWGENQTDYFGRLDYSLFTLFQMVTLENWGEIVRDVAVEHAFYSSIIFSTFVVITGFIMYNLIVAVMCDSMLVIEAQGREEIRQQQKEKQLLKEIKQQEEERNLHEEMQRQRKASGGARDRVKGLVSDDPSVQGRPDETGASELSSEQSLTKVSEEYDDDDEEEIIEMRAVQCPNCEFCHEIPKYTLGELKRRARRDATMVHNQARVRLLKQKIDQLADTQERVTSVLQTLMHEIEANRIAGLSSEAGSTSHSRGVDSLSQGF